MAAKLTKLGRLRKMVEKKSGGIISFRTSDGWDKQIWDAFVFRRYYSIEDVIRSNFFWVIMPKSEGHKPADLACLAYNVFMDEGFEAYLDYAIGVYHDTHGEDYRNREVSIEDTDKTTDILSQKTNE
jgi:hypothetical protein